MKAPFPWFGGKRMVAADVWARFGDVNVYAEPFAGSLAVLLGRPREQWTSDRIETVNDVDGFISNAWRAILHDPEATAHHADWPTNENDLHARHVWLTEHRELLSRRLEGDPEWYDARIAGWWLWGMSVWIGGEFCAGKGPWSRVEVATGDVQLLRDGGPSGVRRRLVHLGSAGRGVSRRLVHLGSAGQGDAGDGECGLVEWMCALSERLRRVRVCCGDWARILTPAALASTEPGSRGIFLDPPYAVEDRSTCYTHDNLTDLAPAVRQWCAERGADLNMRIALCGYGTEHGELEMLGWSVLKWAANGGMQRDKAKRMHERIWFSPGCIDPTKTSRQIGMVW